MFRRHAHPAVWIFATVLGALAFARLAAAPVPAAQQAQGSLPDGRTIVDRFVEAIGGEAAIRSVSSIRARGTFEMAAQGITGTIEVLTARPDKARLRADVSGIGQIERGYDGKVGWSIDPVAGPTLLTGKLLAELIDESHFDGVLHPPDRVSELTTVERTSFDDRSAYKVKVVFASGNEQFEYFDVESGLLIGSEGTREMPGGGSIPRVGYMRDYKLFGKIRHPSTVVEQMQVLGVEQVVRLTSLEYDVVPADAFALPAEIKALIGG